MKHNITIYNRYHHHRIILSLSFTFLHHLRLGNMKSPMHFTNSEVPGIEGIGFLDAKYGGFLDQ